MKCFPYVFEVVPELVALFARAWIEIMVFTAYRLCKRVALFARAWIEIILANQGVGVGVGRPLCEGVD